MANNYIEGSILIQLPRKALIYAAELYARMCEETLTPEDKESIQWDDNFNGIEPFHLEVSSHSMALWNEDCFPAELVASFVHHLLKKFNLNQVVVITWAEYCSKPRPDEFGGGAVFVCKNAIDFLDQSAWIEECKKKYGCK